MRLVKDRNPGAFAVQVVCVGHEHMGKPMFTLAEGYADLDGRAFVDYYCDRCVAASPQLTAAIVGTP